MSKTIRRDKLMRLARAGKLVCTKSYHYDEMSGQGGIQVELPVAFMEIFGFMFTAIQALILGC